MTECACPHCGAILEAPAPKKPRSLPQHRRYMALCAAAFEHWPSVDADFRPKSASHLRYHLEVQAGAFDVTKTARIMSADPDKLYALMLAFLQHSDDEKLFIELDGNLLIEKKAKSIAYDEMPQEEFNKLVNDVSEIIEAAIGVDAEKLLRETERAA